MPKLLHIADLHLDSRFVNTSVHDAVRKRARMREVFRSALEYAKDNDCALTLISGDLFDSEFYTLDTLSFLRECFSSMPEHKFVICPGNHDPIGASSPYRFADFPDNVFVFDSEELSYFDFSDIGVRIYGYAFTSDYYGKCPIPSSFTLPETENFNVLCAHTELDAHRSPYASISTAALGDIGFDYAALGHIHKSEGVKKISKTTYAYSGCIAGRNFSETGEKGGILVTLDRIGKAKDVSARSVRFCPWVYEDVTVSVNGAHTESEILDTVIKKLDSVKKSPELEYVIRVTLCGEIHLELDIKALSDKLTAHGVSEIKNDTSYLRADIGLDNDYSLRGEFFRTLKPLLDSDDPEQRKTAEAALKYGLTALGAGEIEI